MNRLVPFIKKYKTPTIIIGIGFVLFCWWAVVNFMPHPLGGKMEYLGKEDYGNMLGFDYRPYSVYYYATDMQPEEMAGYFGAKLERPIVDKLTYIDVDLVRNGESFTLTYESSDTFKTSKQYIVSMTDEYYGIANKYYQR
jgi:hypothetical protein